MTPGLGSTLSQPGTASGRRAAGRTCRSLMDNQRSTVVWNIQRSSKLLLEFHPERPARRITSYAQVDFEKDLPRLNRSLMVIGDSRDSAMYPELLRLGIPRLQWVACIGASQHNALKDQPPNRKNPMWFDDLRSFFIPRLM